MSVRILSALLAAALVAPVARAQDKPQKPAEPGSKPLILQIDASKLPPELLKELLKQAKPVGEPTKPGAEKPTVKPGTEKPGTEKPVVKPGTEKPGTEKPTVKPVKTIGLTDAIAIAEKTTQGTAVRAERKGDVFVVEVQTKGGKTTVSVDGGGKVTGDKGSEKGEKGDDKEEGKGKKKKDDDDDDKEKKGKKKDD